MEPLRQNFIQIIDSYKGIIRSLCKVYCSSHEDKKDAFQDIILQLWKSFETFKGESKISTWIYSVSLNTLLAKVRTEKRKIAIEHMDVAELPISTAMADSDVELLYIVVQSLKEVDKAIVILYLEGYKNKEIGQMLGLTMTNVSTRLNRIKGELKTKFEHHHHEFRQP